MATEYQEIIKDGPAAAELVHAFLYAYDPRHHFLVEFKLLPIAVAQAGAFWQPLVTHARVIGLSYESGSTGHFNIDLYVVAAGRERRARGYYNANTRTGTLMVDA